MELYDTGGELAAISSTSQHLRLCRPILKARSLLHRSQPILYLITTRFVVGKPSRCEPTITAAGLSAVRFEEGFRLEAAMAKVGQTWTEDRIELLTKLWREGLSASQIAAELGGDVSRNSVLGKANRLDLVRNEVKGARTPRPRQPDRLMAPHQVAPSQPGPALPSAKTREQPPKAPAVTAASGE